MSEYILKFFKLLFIFWDREKECKQGWGRERGDTESEEDSSLWAVSTEPDAGLEPMNGVTMTWAEVRCPTDSHPGALQNTFFNELLLKTCLLAMHEFSKYVIYVKISGFCPLIFELW